MWASQALTLSGCRSSSAATAAAGPEGAVALAPDDAAGAAAAACHSPSVSSTPAHASVAARCRNSSARVALASAEPGAMPRVLEFFAKRNLVPLRWVSQLTGPGESELSMDIQVAGVTPEVGLYIARCIDQLHDVHLVLTSEKTAA